MRSFLSASRSQSFLRLSVVALLGGSAAACSSDVARFNDPNTSPYASQGAPTYTGSVAAAPTGAVQRAPTQQVATAYPGPYGTPAAQAPYGAPAAPQPLAAAPAAPNYGTTPYVSPNYAAVVPPQSQQQPLYGAKPVAAAPAPQQLAVAAPTARMPAPAVAAHAAAPVRTAATAGASHVVTSGQTLSSLSRQYGVSRSALAAANGLDINSPVQIGQTITIPGAAGAAPVVAAAPKPAATPAIKPATVAAAPTTAVTPVAAAPKTAAVASAPIAAPTEPKAQTIAAVKPSETPDDVRADNGVQFRWPVRGRVISGFGPKPGGQQNEGINISVPEGTSVKAAEDGVVAYAGSELKGYGNLVLIKHADGWVTAYANNSALDVKKGDSVKRGQVIAKAGQTGNVNTPQVHFEIRKGSQPVDPSQHLAGL